VKVTAGRADRRAMGRHTLRQLRMAGRLEGEWGQSPQ